MARRYEDISHRIRGEADERYLLSDPFQLPVAITMGLQAQCRKRPAKLLYVLRGHWLSRLSSKDAM